MRGDVGRGAKESLFKRAYRSVSDWADRNSVNVYVFDCGCCFSGRSPGSVISSESEGISYVFSPRQADVLAIFGALSRKSAPLLRRIYEQMPNPRGVIAAGSCASGGGIFADSYATVPDISSIVPVDVYICGCPVSPIEFQSAVKSLFAAKVSEQD
ncbi:nADH-quinone oxidoreductase subunit B [Acetobacter sp. CAG:977]|nr:nADH-quinone oxidoreductase subunit B [Acetobacter sp. CAG:977]